MLDQAALLGRHRPTITRSSALVELDKSESDQDEEDNALPDADDSTLEESLRAVFESEGDGGGEGYSSDDLIVDSIFKPIPGGRSPSSIPALDLTAIMYEEEQDDGTIETGTDTGAEPESHPKRVSTEESYGDSSC